jgi:uncharacterized iron-regulated membrane protein
MGNQPAAEHSQWPVQLQAIKSRGDAAAPVLLQLPFGPQMSTARLLRRIHYWVSLPLLFTIFVIAGTGALLALKKDFAALQPITQSGARPGDLGRPLADAVAAVRTVPGHAGTTWQDVERIDVRPADGIAKVILHSRTEVQVDLATGKALQVGYRTSDWLETLHDFSIIGPWAKYAFSFGTGIALLAMAASGAYMFVLPLLVKRRKRKAARAKSAAQSDRGGRGIAPASTARKR